MGIPSLLKLRMSDLLPHEMCREEDVDDLVRDFKARRILERPIAVYDLSLYNVPKYLIIDGHHRVGSLRKLGYSYVMANPIDYFFPVYKALSWQNEKEWDKNEIIWHAMDRRLLEPKSTKHVLAVCGNTYHFQDNGIIQPIINCPLEILK